MISSKSARVDASIAVMPQSSSSNTSVFLSVSSQRVNVPLAWRMRSSSTGGVPPCDYGQRAMQCISINRNQSQ